MKKLGILLDSFSGETKKEINKMGLEMVSQQIIIDGNLYKEGQDLNFDNSVEIIDKANDIKSSMPIIGEVTEAMERMSKEYENVIYMPMNKKMSSTYSVGKTVAAEFKNVHVIDMKLFSKAIIDVAQTAFEIGNKKKTIEEVIDFIQASSDKSVGYIVVKNTEKMIKSGRLGPKVGGAIQKIKLILRLSITDDGLKLSSTRRNFQKLMKSTIEKLIDKIGGNDQIENYNFAIASTGTDDMDEYVEELLKSFNVKNIQKANVAPATYGHTGNGAIGIVSWPKKTLLLTD